MTASLEGAVSYNAVRIHIIACMLCKTNLLPTHAIYVPVKKGFKASRSSLAY